MPLRFSIDIIFVEAEEELKTNTKSHNKISLINRFSRYRIGARLSEYSICLNWYISGWPG